MGLGGQLTTQPIYPRERHDTHCIGGWVGQVWTGAENLAPHRDPVPGPSSPYQVAIPTALSQLTLQHERKIDIKTGFRK